MEVLYPVVYELECFVQGTRTNDQNIGRITILTHKNEPIVAADVSTSQHFAAALVTLTFSPELEAKFAGK